MTSQNRYINEEITRVRMRGQIVSVFWFIVANWCGLSEEKRHLTVGGIFDENKDEVEQAFRLATDIINSKQGTQSVYLQPAVYRVASGNTLAVSAAICELLGLEIVGLFGPNSPTTSKHVQSVCDNKEMPHIETHWDATSERNNVINLHPHPSKIEQILIQILGLYRWKKFTIIYDGNENLIKMNTLLLYKRNEHSFALKQFDPDESNYRKLLYNIKKEGETHFVLVCTTDTLRKFFEQAQQVGLLTEHHHYFIYNFDFHTIDMEPYQYAGSNITAMRFFDPNSAGVTEFKNQLFTYSNGQHPEGETITFETALTYDALELFHQALNDSRTSNNLNPKPLYCDSDYIWEEGYSILNHMKMKEISGLTGTIQLDAEGFRSNFDVELVELVEEGWMKIGHYNEEKGLQLQREHKQDEAQADDGTLRNKSFIIIAVLTPPYGQLKETTIQLYGNDRFEGFGIDLVQELSSMLGFNYTFIIEESGANGNFDRKTHKWTGMIGAVLYGEADFAIGDLTITSEREQAVDFTLPFMTLGISILYKKPKPVPPSLFMFTSPFSGEVWLLLGISYLCVSLFLFVLGRLCPSEWINPYPCTEDPDHLTNQFSFKNSLWFAIGSLMQQGTEIAPIGASTRMLAGVWWFFTLIMVSSYTANLAAFLTVETLVTPFKNIEELASQTEIKYGAKADGATSNFFRDSDRDVHKNIYRYMLRNKEAMTKDNNDGVYKVENENYAFLMESTSIEYVVEKNCSLTQVGQRLDDKGYGIAMKKGSKYRQILNSAILKLQENGKITTLKIKWWKEKNSGNCDSVQSKGAVTPLSLQNVGGVFLVLGVGTFLGLLLVFLEISYKSYRRAKKEETKFKEEMKGEIEFFLKFKKSVKPVKQSSHNSAESNSMDNMDNYYNETR